MNATSCLMSFAGGNITLQFKDCDAEEWTREVRVRKAGTNKAAVNNNTEKEKDSIDDSDK